jgi:hypothetical protein
MFRSLLPLLFLTATLNAQEAAKAPAPTLAGALAANRTTLTFRDGKLSGSGAAILDRELATTQFFLVGEDHGTAEMARLTSALFERGYAHGYRHLAVEVGPIAVEKILATPGDPYETIAAWNRRYPFSLPFLSWKEEARLIADAVRITGARTGAVWGLDQEFILSSAYHLDRLATLAPNDEARAVVTALQKRAREGDEQMVSEHDPSKVWMLNATAEDFASLRRVFGNASVEATRIIAELDQSAEVYRLGSTDGWRSNQQRSAMMKRIFADAYRKAVAAGEQQPKVLVKFGGTHTMRGRSMYGVFDLGTLLPELAALNGTRSFQMFVLPAAGHVNTWRPFAPDEASKRTAYDPLKDLPMDSQPLLAAAVPGEWTLIDLRPIHALLARGKVDPVEPRLKNVLLGYDAILIAPTVTPATLFE